MQMEIHYKIQVFAFHKAQKKTSAMSLRLEVSDANMFTV